MANPFAMSVIGSGGAPSVGDTSPTGGRSAGTFTSGAGESKDIQGAITRLLGSINGGSSPALPHGVGGSGGSSPGMGTYGNPLPPAGNAGNPHGGAAAQAQALARQLAAQRGWTGAEFDALNNVAMRESGWNPYAVNRSSGAYGIGQSLGHGHPYELGDIPAQVRWFLNYIAQRYGSPSGAWQHERSQGWY